MNDDFILSVCSSKGINHAIDHAKKELKEKGYTNKTATIIKKGDVIWAFKKKTIQ